MELSTLFLGKMMHRLDETDSTNVWLAARLHENPVEGTVVLSDFQTAGKGQTGNTWLAEPGSNLTFSLLFRPRFLPPTAAFYLSKMVSVALHRTLTECLPDAEVHIKWPNDLLVNEHKIAGILIENQFSGKEIKNSIIGIGLNVNQREFPGGGYGRATSLRLESGKEWDRDALLERVLQHLEGAYLQLKSGKKEAIDRYYLQHLWAYQEVTTLRIQGKEQPGVVTGVDAAGRLAVQLGQKLVYFQMKEVEFCF